MLVCVLEDLKFELEWDMQGKEGARHTADFNFGMQAAIDRVQDELNILEGRKECLVYLNRREKWTKYGYL